MIVSNQIPESRLFWDAEMLMFASGCNIHGLMPTMTPQGRQLKTQVRIWWVWCITGFGFVGNYFLFWVLQSCGDEYIFNSYCYLAWKSAIISISKYILK